MPCRSYESDWVNHSPRKNSAEMIALKNEADKLARIACKAINALENGVSYKELLKDREVKTWYTVHRANDAKRIEAEEKQRIKDEKQRIKDEELANARASVMAKLTPEEIEAFGLNKKENPKKRKSNREY